MNNIALDVVIGLVFVFLLYSLLATIVLEILAQFFDLRSRMLVKTMRILLDDRDANPKYWLSKWASHFWNNIYHFFYPLQKESFSRLFYSHPSIKYLSRSNWASKPSYIGSNIFSSTIISLLRGVDYQDSQPQINAIQNTIFSKKTITVGTQTVNIGQETLTQLQTIYINSGKDIDRFKLLLAQWFDETMERSGGWYKQQTQVLLLCIGFFIAWAFNVNSIAISKILSTNETARAQMVQLATNSAPKYEEIISKIKSKKGTPVTVTQTDSTGKTTSATVITDTIFITDKEIKETQEAIKSDIAKASTILGLGRPNPDSCKVCKGLAAQKTKEKNGFKKQTFDTKINQHQQEVCNKPNDSTTYAGWLLTALAISLGAPFWFDLLNKVVQLRSSIAKPKNADTGGGSSKLNDETGASINPVG